MYTTTIFFLLSVIERNINSSSESLYITLASNFFLIIINEYELV